MEKIAKFAWLALAIVVAVCIPIYGAWHHVWTVLICVLMYSMMGTEKKPAQPETEEAPEDITE